VGLAVKCVFMRQQALDDVMNVVDLLIKQARNACLLE
jgi:hypothetical protein